MGKVTDYNLATLQVTCRGVPVTGWGSEDALSIARRADMAEHEKSGDGVHDVVSGINDNSCDITFTLQWGTVASKLLFELAQEQRTEMKSGAVSPLAFQVYDDVTGYKFVEKTLRFMRLPDIELSGTPGDVEFKAIAPDPVETYGANIANG